MMQGRRLGCGMQPYFELDKRVFLARRRQDPQEMSGCLRLHAHAEIDLATCGVVFLPAVATALFALVDVSIVP